MSQQYNVAILGATGAVGETILEVLQERKFPVGELFLLASERSEGKTYRFNGKTVRVQNVEEFDWSQAHIALFSAGGDLSAKWAPIAADEGVIVIDNTSHFRYEYDIPLVVPEVNPEAIAEFRNRNIIANPNCSTIQMLVALKPIHDAVGIERINVSTYQSVSGAGKAGIDELAGQTAKLLNGLPADKKQFSQQIAFNCIPQIDQMMENGYTKEEMKMVWETQKIFNDPSITVNPTCVRVPVFYGHAEAVHVETRSPIDA
ncbi:aspartate-semialdehyde dehydrogenase, partial [Vibrio parahaemolyticus]|nr:aspartate-semialdehyde dehydrogenase [Vibrio parahaemolyticus]